MPWLDKLAAWVQEVLLPLGVWGLAPAAVLDSSFLSLAGGVDLWLVSLCVRDSARTPLYVLIATLGSVAGASALYLAVRKGGEVVLKKKLPLARLSRVRLKVERYGSWALLVAALLPPPAPFKMFIIAAGLLRHPLERFVLALLVGRLIRYSLEGLLAARYGRQAWEWLLRSGPWVIVAVLLALILVIAARKIRGKTSPVVQ